MMAKFGVILSALLLMASQAFAEFRTDPDANTLWIEDGAQIATGKGPSASHWDDTMILSPLPEGGFSVQSPSSDRHTTGRHVKFDPQYPWLVWKIAEITPGTGYRAFAMRALGGEAFGVIVTHIQTGLYTVDVANAIPTGRPPYFRIELYNATLKLKYIKLVKQPENYLQVTSPSFAAKKALDFGDELTFKVVLAEPAEDVSLRFYDTYVMPQLAINGSQSLQLKPENANPKIWSATIKIESCTGGRVKPNLPFEPGGFAIKAVVLGGKLDKPIWTFNPVKFRLNTAAAPAGK